MLSLRALAVVTLAAVTFLAAGCGDREGPSRRATTRPARGERGPATRPAPAPGPEPAPAPAPEPGPAPTTRAAARTPRPPGEEWKTGKPYLCRRAGGPVTIDGKWRPEQWQHAMVVKDFKVPVSGSPVKSATEARLLWDDEHLYVNFRASDRDIKATYTKRTDPLYREDVVEVFLKPDDDKPAYYEFEINPLGTVMALEIPARKDKGIKKCSNWETGITAAVQVAGSLNEDANLDNFYRAAMAIPWKNLKHFGGKPPKVGREIKFNLCRYDYSKYLPSTEEQTSAPLTSQDFHHYEDYSVLRFVE